jgi:hypothetical protein
MKHTLLPLLALALLTQCHKSAPDPAKPEDQLPAATQTGADTFGCLVNGQPYTPKGYVGSANFAVLFDPTYRGGNLEVRTYRVDGNTRQYLTLGGDGIAKTGVFPLERQYNTGLSYTNTTLAFPCNGYRSADTQVYYKGALTITRLDQQAGIVSGTFNCKLWQPGCDTLRFTQGRFDYKL